MRHPRIVIGGIALAAVAAVGGVTAAAADSSPATSASASGAAGTSTAGAGHSATAATVRTARVTVAGKTATILVNAHGLPLYFYRPDTAAKSFVTGGLARLWPPLTSAAPTAGGASGKVTVVSDANGQQVAYNGHLLYTFISDHPGQVTGQGVQNFFVATPGLAPITAASAGAGSAPAAPASGYGY